jgi:hypothetical protein
MFQNKLGTGDLGSGNLRDLWLDLFLVDEQQLRQGEERLALPEPY